MKHKTIAACALACAALVGLAVPAQAAKPENAKMNQASYWESADSSCAKIEFGNGVKSFTLPELGDGLAYSLLVLKAGSGASAHQVIDGGDLFEGTPYWHQTGKDLSHAILCVTDEGYTGYPRS